jgi:hypothetical protein
MLRALLLGLALIAPKAFADSDRCARNDFYPQRCFATPGCTYDYQWEACRDQVGGGGGGGGGGSRACSAYDYDQRTCDSQPNCQYDTWQRRCVDSWNPGPGPGPGPGTQCYYYRDQRQCDRTAGCYWDQRSYSCLDQWDNPGPGPQRPVTTTIRCSSSQNRYNYCGIRGQIVSAYLSRQTSGAYCQQGTSWGYDQGGVWVDRGCAADFTVSYYNY